MGSGGASLPVLRRDGDEGAGLPGSGDPTEAGIGQRCRSAQTHTIVSCHQKSLLPFVKVAAVPPAWGAKMRKLILAASMLGVVLRRCWASSSSVGVMTAV